MISAFLNKNKNFCVSSWLLFFEKEVSSWLKHGVATQIGLTYISSVTNTTITQQSISGKLLHFVVKLLCL